MDSFANIGSPASLESAALAVVGGISAIVATTTDLRTGRISNWNTGIVALLVMGIRATGGGAASVSWGALGGCIASLMVVAPYRATKIGAGDAKLFVALGLLIGPVGAVYMAPTTLALAGAIAMLKGRGALVAVNATQSVPLAPAIGLGALGGAVLAAVG